MRAGKFIGVIGSGDCSEEEYSLAFEVGREVARRGFYLVCGGLSGVMEASAKGAFMEGGLTIGILPGDKKDANPYIKIPIPTGLGEGRNLIIVRLSDALIAIGGEYGTLSEIAFALKLKKPVIGLRTWDIEGIIRAESPEDAVSKATGSL